DGIRDDLVTGVQTCALPIFRAASLQRVRDVPPLRATLPLRRRALTPRRRARPGGSPMRVFRRTDIAAVRLAPSADTAPVALDVRSEERRVGNEWRWEERARQ